MRCTHHRPQNVYHHSCICTVNSIHWTKYSVKMVNNIVTVNIKIVYVFNWCYLVPQNEDISSVRRSFNLRVILPVSVPNSQRFASRTEFRVRLRVRVKVRVGLRLEFGFRLWSEV